MPDKFYTVIQSIRDQFMGVNDRPRNSLLNSLKKLSEDLYSKDTHFIFELIQNAEDNEYDKNANPTLMFELLKTDPTHSQNSNGVLIIYNNETGFTENNIDAICNVGKTTKTDKSQGYIGEKGIGFKSVFKVSAAPHILSSGYYFSLPEYDDESGLGYIVPKWVNADNNGFLSSLIKKQGTVIILPLNKPNFSYTVIEKMLRDIKDVSILFLKKIKHIRIKTDSGDDFKIARIDKDNHTVEINITGLKKNNNLSENNVYYIFSKSFEKPVDIIQEDRKEIERRDVFVVFPNRYSADEAGKMFAYLPIEKKSGFPFLINADFILTSNREDIKDDAGTRAWNKWLMESIAKTVAKDALPFLANNNLLTLEILEYLSRRMMQFSAGNRDSIFYPIYSEILTVMKEQKLLPANDGKFVSANEALLVGREDLVELLDNADMLSSLFGKKYWLNKAITSTNTKYSSIYNFLHNFLSIHDIDFYKFLDSLKASFLEAQDDPWFIKFYSLLMKGNYANLIVKAKSKPIIRAIYKGNQQQMTPANVYISNGDDINLPIVKPELCKTDEIKQFLIDKLGVKKFNEVANIIENVLPKYNHRSELVPIDDNLQHIAIIEKAYRESTNNDKTLLISKLQQTPFIKAVDVENNDLGYKSPADLYFMSVELKNYFYLNKTIGFVSDIYNTSGIRNMLQTLGVKSEVKITRKQCDFNGHVIIRANWGDHARGLSRFDPNITVEGLIDSLVTLKELPNPDMKLERSKFIWNKIAMPHLDCISGIVEKSNYQNFPSPTEKAREYSPAFGNRLVNISWLPNKDGIYKKSSELKLSDLPDGFQPNDALAKKLGMKEDLLAQQLAKYGVSQDDINFISNYKKEFIKWKEEKQRQKDQASFPEEISSTPELRKRKIKERANSESDRKHKIKPISVAITGDESERSHVNLVNQYTDDNKILRCQMCDVLSTSPFKANDEWRYEKTPFLKSIRDKTHPQNFLVLCHNHAAMFQFIADNELEHIEERLLDWKIGNERKMTINLLEKDMELRFTSNHILDLQAILELKKKEEQP